LDFGQITPKSRDITYTGTEIFFAGVSSVVSMMLVAVRLATVAQPEAVAVARLAIALAVSCWSMTESLALLSTESASW
jgi:hypothetical protein